MPKLSNLNKLTALLEVASVLVALVALVFRSTWYWKIPVAPGEPYGVGDLIDFGLGLATFVICSACAASAVLLITMTPTKDRTSAPYRAMFVGMGAFLLYYFLHPHMPRLL